MLTCSYAGDCTEVVVGQIVGPDARGQLYEAVDARYEPSTGRTLVQLAPVVPEDTRAGYRDQWGLFRVVDA